LVLLGYIGWEGWIAAGWQGLLWIEAFMVVVFCCVVAHEFGHALTAQRFGVHVPRILLLPIGGMAEFDRIPRRPRHEMLIALAGPAVNGIIVLLLFAGGMRFPVDWNPLVFPLTWPEFARHVAAVNIVMGLFNLLPIFPMDGGRVLRALLAMKLSYLQATRWAAWTGKILSLAGLAIMGLAFDPPHWIGVALFGFIFFAGEMEYRATRRREDDARRWRETLDRFYRDAGLEVPADGKRKAE
jgi:Zn-dependent protease